MSVELWDMERTRRTKQTHRLFGRSPWGCRGRCGKDAVECAKYVSKG